MASNKKSKQLLAKKRSDNKKVQKSLDPVTRTSKMKRNVKCDKEIASNSSTCCSSTASKRKQTVPHRKQSYTVMYLYRRPCKVVADFKKQIRRLNLRSGARIPKSLLTSAVYHIVQKYGFNPKVKHAMLVVVREVYEAGYVITV